MIRERVDASRSIQHQRFKGTGVKTNAEMSVKDLQSYCQLDGEAEQILRAAIDRLGLSARAYHRTIKVARTVADLAGVS